jgi:hypothetical protein
MRAKLFGPFLACRFALIVTIAYLAAKEKIDPELATLSGIIVGWCEQSRTCRSHFVIQLCCNSVLRITMVGSEQLGSVAVNMKARPEIAVLFQMPDRNDGRSLILLAGTAGCLVHCRGGLIGPGWADSETRERPYAARHSQVCLDS